VANKFNPLATALDLGTEGGTNIGNVRSRIRQITYDRGLRRKSLGDPEYKNPHYELELSRLRKWAKENKGGS
jgi:hypothetical protein